MGFIKNALIGIALYEAVKYFLGKKDYGFAFDRECIQGVIGSRQRLRDEEVDLIAGARQTNQLEQLKENALSDGNSSGRGRGPGESSLQEGDDLAVGSDPKAPLTGQREEKTGERTWKNSLANDDLRAPDS
jgi:hypothetical protein